MRIIISMVTATNWHSNCQDLLLNDLFTNTNYRSNKFQLAYVRFKIPNSKVTNHRCMRLQLSFIYRFLALTPGFFPFPNKAAADQKTIKKHSFSLTWFFLKCSYYSYSYNWNKKKLKKEWWLFPLYFSPWKSLYIEQNHHPRVNWLLLILKIKKK